MAAVTPVPRYVRMANVLTRTLLRAGLPMNGPGKSPMYLLTVPGRKSGQPRTTPIATIEQDGVRYIMTPYGVVDWVRNLRAAGEGTLTRGRHREVFRTDELPVAEGAIVLKRFLATGNPIARFFAIPDDATDADIAAAAARHPVFRVTPLSSRSGPGAAR